MSDLDKAVALRKMKAVALLLLFAAAALYIVARTHDGSTAWGYVRAFSEAAMIGALADWFAVTALFRHPLGLPIPHTAIIPNRKDEIGKSLGEFVETNFLSNEILDERLGALDLGRRTGEWLSVDANASRASGALAELMQGAIEVVDDNEVQDALGRTIERRIQATEISPLLGRMVEIAIEGGHHQRLLDATFTGLRGFLADNRVTFRERLEHESPWWVPNAIDNRVFAKIYDGVNRFLDDVGADRNHEVRVSIEQRIVTLAHRLRNDPELIAQGERVKAELLEHPDFTAWIESLWRDAKSGFIAAASQPDSELRERMTTSVRTFGERLRDDVELQHKLNRWVSQALHHVVTNYRSEVSALIESTVSRWDGESTSRKLELQVGRDLQFIRINGTIVGGLAGLAIHAASESFF